jgi:uncharacterized membrane protein (UPF0127 family)
MRMPIDVEFIDREWNVLSVHAAVAPGRMLRDSKAYAVLEMAAGEAGRLEIAPGSRLYERSARQI